MINKEDYKQFSEKMDRTISVLEEQFAAVRAGRANPAILDKITVEYYGTETPINQVGNITVPEARMLVFQPWDVTVLKAAEKAIQKSDIGINPNNDGKTLKLVFSSAYGGTQDRTDKTGEKVRRRCENCYAQYPSGCDGAF